MSKKSWGTGSTPVRWQVGGGEASGSYKGVYPLSFYMYLPEGMLKDANDRYLLYEDRIVYSDPTLLSLINTSDCIYARDRGNLGKCDFYVFNGGSSSKDESMWLFTSGGDDTVHPGESYYLKSYYLSEVSGNGCDPYIGNKKAYWNEDQGLNLEKDKKADYEVYAATPSNVMRLRDISGMLCVQNDQIYLKNSGFMTWATPGGSWVARKLYLENIDPSFDNIISDQNNASTWRVYNR